MKKLKYHIRGTLNNGMRPFMSATIKRYLDYSGFIKKTDGTIPDASCLVHAVRRIFDKIMGYSVLEQINETHLSTNNSGVSFPML